MKMIEGIFLLQTTDSVASKEAFYRNSLGEEVACDSVRFAVGDRETGNRSAIWSAMYSKAKNSSDLFLASDGLSNDIKVTFHPRDAIVAYRRESLESLIERGAIAADAKRQTESVPILQEPFMVASIAFFPELMKPPHKRRDLSGKPITVITPLPTTEFLRVHVVHSFDEPAELIDHISGQQLSWFARLRSGNRHLTFFHMAYETDWASQRQAIQKYVDQVPARNDLVELVRKEDVSVMFWGVDNSHLNFFEVHSLRVIDANASPLPLWERATQRS